MADLDQRLRADAEQIAATASPELQARIDASLRATRRSRTVSDPSPMTGSLWLVSSLTGLGVAALVLLLLNWNAPVETAPANVVVETPATPDVGGAAERWQMPPDLELRNAGVTGPLEQEMSDLQSDLERVRDKIERDLAASF